MKLFLKTFVVSLIFAPAFAFAISPILPFAGKVVDAPIPDAVCPGGVPVSPYGIKPVVGLPGMYVTTQWVKGFGFIRTDSWILGLYSTIPIPECVAVPPFNEGFRTILYGTNTILPL